MKSPKIKIEFACSHSYPVVGGRGLRTEHGHSIVSVRVRVEYKKSEHGTIWGSSEMVEVASRRIDWEKGLDCSDEAMEKGAKWAAEGLAEALRKLWPENAL
jgi:hypothetical protein